MPLTLVTTAPDGAVTRNRPVMHGPAVMLAVSHTLRSLGLPRFVADTDAAVVLRTSPGTTYHHTITGYSFSIEETP